MYYTHTEGGKRFFTISKKKTVSARKKNPFFATKHNFLKFESKNEQRIKIFACESFYRLEYRNKKNRKKRKKIL